MKFCATLNYQEVLKFIEDFYSLEHAQTTQIQIESTKYHGRSKVILVPIQNKICEKLLEASFYEGLMHHWGWDKKFEKCYNKNCHSCGRA